MRFWVLIASSSMLVACATDPTAGAESVRVTSSQDAASGCRALGQVSVTAHSMPVNITRENAIARARNQVVALGGNLLVSSGPQVTMPGPVATVNGDAYACG